MTSMEFFDTHPVFTRQEFAEARGSQTPARLRTTDSLLRRYVTSGRLLRVKGGVYAVVRSPGLDPDRAAVDPYLVATKLAPDATVAYHAALQFWGKAYSLWRRFHFATVTSTRPLRCRQLEFLPVKIPRALRESRKPTTGVVEQRHAGGTVRVSTLERTLVDVLDVPANAGGWEEIWRSLEMIEFFDLEAVVSYALELQSALTAARVGFFLEQHRDLLMVEDVHLARLREHRPRQARYFDRRRTTGRLVRSWNVIVPDDVLGRTWAEVA